MFPVLSKSGTPLEKIDVVVFDRTADATLVLWDVTAASASKWTPSSTILLLSGSAYKAGKRPSLSINSNTTVNIDPSIDEANWLRKYAKTLTKHVHVNPPFPVGGKAVQTFGANELLTILQYVTWRNLIMHNNVSCSRWLRSTKCKIQFMKFSEWILNKFWSGLESLPLVGDY